MDPAITTVKEVLSLTAALIVAAVIFSGLFGVYKNVNQKDTVNWINDELKPAVSHQCRQCLTCPGGENPHPGDWIQQRFRSEEMDLEWKGNNDNQLHLVTKDEDGDVDLSVRIAVSRAGHIVPGFGCDKGDGVSLSEATSGATSGPGIKEFRVYPNNNGAEIRVR